MQSRFKELRRFLEWCDDRDISAPDQLTLPMLERYQRHLFNLRKGRGGAPLSAHTQSMLLNAVRQFCKWLARNNFILYNPAADLVMPKEPVRLPQSVLSPNEVEYLLCQPDIQTPMGIRDRAMLELMYSTGARRSEVLGLEVTDLNVEQAVLLIRDGKGARDRMVPVGARALRWTMKYLTDVRPEFVARCPDSRILFLTDQGTAPSCEYITHKFRRYKEAAGIEKGGACHILRHSMATGMLEGGADVRFIQEILGHVNLKTTQVYTRVSIGKLREVHAATHPAERGRRTRENSDLAGEGVAEPVS